MSTNATPTTVKFVALDATGLPVKRKQVAHACDACRRKKKRCAHGEHDALDNTEVPSVSKSERPILTARPVSSRPRPTTRSATSDSLPLPVPNSPPYSSESGVDADDGDSETAASQLLELSSRRFVGDMNPESVLLQATTPALNPGDSYRDQSNLGIWIPPLQHTLLGDSPHSVASILASPPSLEGPQKYHHSSRSAVTQAYERIRRGYLQECLDLYPPETEYQALKTIFLEKIHPIFPVFAVTDLVAGKPTTAYHTLIRQIVALCAAADPKAVSHLRLESGGRLLMFQEFHQRLSAAVFTIIDAALLCDKLQFVRVNAVMAMFYQPANASQRNKAACLGGQAVHALQTVGAHLLGYRPQNDDGDVEGLYCAVWALDRIACTMNARPTNMHERDTDIVIEERIAQQPPAFQLFLKIVLDLNRVIELYRPRQTFKVLDIPVLETLMVEAGADKLSTTLLGTLEVFHHAISVLSCRQSTSSSSDTSSRTDFSYIPQASVNARLSLSADRIVWVVQNQEVCPFPFIPYAVSLALSVQYRKMRYSRTAMFRNRACGIFREIVGLLSGMGHVYSSARVNARLGESILREMGKTACTLARDEIENTSGLVNAPGTNGELRPRVTPSSAALTAVSIPPAEDGINTMPNSLLTTANPVPNILLQEGTANAAASGMMAVDHTILDNWDMDVDLFGYFDPNFDLGAIDTALEANLDMGFPQDWMSCWSQLGT